MPALPGGSWGDGELPSTPLRTRPLFSIQGWNQCRGPIVAFALSADQPSARPY